MEEIQRLRCYESAKAEADAATRREEARPARPGTASKDKCIQRCISVNLPSSGK